MGRRDEVHETTTWLDKALSFSAKEEKSRSSTTKTLLRPVKVAAWKNYRLKRRTVNTQC